MTETATVPTFATVTGARTMLETLAETFRPDRGWKKEADR